MDHFTYQNNELFAENVAISRITAEVGTPFYCYSQATLSRHYNVFSGLFKERDHVVCFAVKANSNIAVLKVLADLGSGFDTVSEGEIRRVIKAGADPKKIVFSGVGKTKNEMRYALEIRIMQFNVESEAELNALNEVAGEMGIKAPIALRVNPDVDAKTHAKISTGKKENKFGIPIDQAPALYKKASSLNNINVKSVSTHIGSQLLDINPFREAFLRVMSLVADLKNDGHNIDTIDFGGGIGITYSDENNISLESYAKMINEVTENFDGKVVFEPGRLIAGNAGILVSEVIYTKPTDARNFVIIDAAMNDLIRPSMYGAHHDIIPVQKAKSTDIEQDFVGPVCETGDTFAEQRKSAAVKSGELIAIRSCGAYGAVMSNEYNTRPLIPEVLVNGEKFAVIRKRPSYDEILQRDLIPNW